MAPRITNNTGINQFTNVPTEMQTYIPAMYQNGADCYESKGKKTSRIIKSVTSIFNSVLLTAGLAIGGFFGFKWLKGSNLSFMSKPLQKYDFKDVANLKSEDIKGNEKQKEELKNVIDYCIKHKNKDGIPKGCGVLLQGPPRCGKTMSAKVFAKESGLTTFSCKSDDIISSVRGQTEKNVDKLFEQLRKRVKKDGKPVILIMDEIDSFLMKRDNATNEERAMVNAFLRNCDELEKQGIIILGSTNYSDKCDKAAVGSGRFNHTIQFDLPKKDDLEGMLRKGKKKLSDGEDDISKIASFMAEHHMNWADAQNVLNKYTTSNGNIDYKDAMLYLIEKCQGNSTVQISSLIQEDPPGTKTLDWNDIVGQSNVKKELENLANDIKENRKLESDKSGVTLYGPGGCGKTTLPYALGKKIKSDVYTLRIGENGVTVDNVKSVIEDIKLEGLKRKVQGKEPLILFIDEADAMFTNREGLDISHSVTNSLEKTTTMLNAIQNLQNSGVLCIAATNHLENIDGPIKERLKPLNVGYPNKEDVEEIIKRCIKDFDSGKSLNTEKIANIFCNGETSKLSPRVIISVLQDELKKYQYTTLKKENKDEFYKSLEEIVKNKVEELNKNPLESSLTQISKSLDEIREEIGKISENKEDIETKFEELKGHFKKLDSLSNLEDMKNALVSLRVAIGVPKEGKEKHTLLNIIETLCAELQGLENIKNIGNIGETIDSIKKLAASNNALAQELAPIVSGLGVTMANIKGIADSNTDLMYRYQELAGSVAESMNEVKNVLETNTGAIGNLATAIDSLNKAQGELKTLLDKIKNENKENKGDNQTRMNYFEYYLRTLNESISPIIKTVQALGENTIREKLLLKLNINSEKYGIFYKHDDSFKTVDKVRKRDNSLSYTGIDAFCFPIYDENSNRYTSFLTQMIDTFDKIINPLKNIPTHTVGYLTPDEKQRGVFNVDSFKGHIYGIQESILKNTKIQKLKNLLKDGRFFKGEKGFNDSMECFEKLLNHFNWESLISDEYNIFVNTDISVDDSNDLYIKYSEEQRKVIVSKATIPIIKDAFREIFDIAFNAWINHHIEDLR